MSHNPIKISMVAAIGNKDRAIGKNNKLLWHIKEDMVRFKKLTMGHAVIMGRKTFDSIFEYLGSPLPGRMNVVVTRNSNYSIHGVIRSNSLEDAIEKARSTESVNENPEIFIIGGGQIYEEGIKYADRLYLTIVKSDIDGDTFFPDYSDFNKKISEEFRADGKYEYTFLTLEK